MPTLTEKFPKQLFTYLSSYFSDYSETNWIFCEKEKKLAAMGGMLSYFRGLFGSREMRILILGLDGAGKTTLLYRLQVSCCIIFHVCLLWTRLKSLLPCPFTGPKMFCAGPNFKCLVLLQVPKFFVPVQIYWASPKL